MARFLFTFLSLSFCFLLSNPVKAQSNEMREQFQKLKQEALELIENGQKDRAEELLKQAAQLSQGADKERAQHQSRERASAEIERRIEELRKFGDVKAKIAHAEHQAAQLGAHAGEAPKPFRPDMLLRQPQPDAVQRLEHMRAAVEHLRQAGLKDQAHHVNEIANRLQQDLHHKDGGRDVDPLREIMGQLGELRREVGELRARLDRAEK
jgi:small-conductance mechanosensitive channel